MPGEIIYSKPPDLCEGSMSPTTNMNGKGGSNKPESALRRTRSLRTLRKFVSKVRKGNDSSPHASTLNSSTRSSRDYGPIGAPSSSQAGLVAATSTSHAYVGSTITTLDNQVVNANGRSPRDNPMSNNVEIVANVPSVLSGMSNHGNTCFINAIVQCLAHADLLAEYFVSTKYLNDLQPHSRKSKSFGSEGELTQALARLMEALWFNAYRVPLSRDFHHLTVSWSKKTDGYGFALRQQHDAQEFLVWLLDKVHEDLNSATKKRWKAPKSITRTPSSEERQALAWQQKQAEVHRSFVYDCFQALYRSSVTCPLCQQESITFDPFLCVSLSVPQSQKKALFVNMVYYLRKPRLLRLGLNADQSASFDEVKKCLVLEAKVEASSIILCEVTDNNIGRTFNDGQILTSCLGIGSESTIYAVELPTPVVHIESPGDLVLIVINRKLCDKNSIFRPFGSLFCVRVGRDCSFDELHHAFIGSMKPQLRHAVTANDVPTGAYTLKVCPTAGLGECTLASDLQMPLYVQGVDDALRMQSSSSNPLHLKLVLDWSHTAHQRYFHPADETTFEHRSARELHDELAEPEALSLHDCLGNYTVPEWVAFEGWRCRNCRMLPSHGYKTIRFWSLPDLLVIHLKRFKQMPNGQQVKLQPLIDFPIRSLDMEAFLHQPSSPLADSEVLDGDYSSTLPPASFLRNSRFALNGSNPMNSSVCYDLFAVCNHHGTTMNSGHYTAYCRNPMTEKWYLYDDEKVREINDVESIISKDAYLLFYEKKKAPLSSAILPPLRQAPRSSSVFAGRSNESPIAGSSMNSNGSVNSHWFHSFATTGRPGSSRDTLSGTDDEGYKSSSQQNFSRTSRAHQSLPTRSASNTPRNQANGIPPPTAPVSPSKQTQPISVSSSNCSNTNVAPSIKKPSFEHISALNSSPRSKPRSGIPAVGDVISDDVMNNVNRQTSSPFDGLREVVIAIERRPSAFIERAIKSTSSSSNVVANNGPSLSPQTRSMSQVAANSPHTANGITRDKPMSGKSNARQLRMIKTYSKQETEI